MSKQAANRPTPSGRRPVTSTAARTTTRSSRKPTGMVRPFQMPFEDKNVIFILIGVAIVGLGYFLLSTGPVMGVVSLTIAPIVLCIGYLVVVPYGIAYGARRMKNAEKLVVEEQTINSPV